MHSPTLASRRGFLMFAAGAGVALAFAPDSFASTDSGKAPLSQHFEPTIWYTIDPSGIATVNIIRAEMGQHVGTALARIVADELEVDWNSVRLFYVDSDPKWGLMVTGGSWSVSQSFMLLSQAGAAGRITLIEEGAKLMGVSPDVCMVRSGVVHAGGHSIAYGDIVSRGDLSRRFSAEDIKKIPIKSPKERRLIGMPSAAIDVPAKTNGSAHYGIDAVAPGMVYARPKIPPTRNGSKVVSIDDSAAKAVKGYIKAFALDDPSGTVPGWVMVVADSFVGASRAADAITVIWASDDTSRVSEKDVLDHGRKLIDNPGGGSSVVEDPGVDAAFSGAHSVLDKTYTTSSVLHFQLEPVNALALEREGRWEIYTGNQWQSLIIPILAKALGVSESKVIMRTHLLGGGFGRRLNGDYAVPAALAAKVMGRPVKMLCTRADDARFDSIRSPSIQTLRMAFDSTGAVIGMQHHAAAGWPTQVMIPGFLSKGVNGEPFDPFSISGADHWYNVRAHRVRALSNDLANRTFRPGWLRSVGPGWTNWALESFMDEAAHSLGVDSLNFRLKLLDGVGKNQGSEPVAVGGAHRQAAVLQRVAEKAGWGQEMPKDSGLGIASTFGQERAMPTWVACVARVRVDRSTGIVTLEKLYLVIDAGTVVHPDGALAQAEGAALWGLSMALHEGTELFNGQVRDTNLNSYTPLRMGDVPIMEIEFMPSTDAPVGLGEPATTVVGPAIGNAIFAAVGARLRHLPIRAAAVLSALASPA